MKFLFSKNGNHDFFVGWWCKRKGKFFSILEIMISKKKGKYKKYVQTSGIYSPWGTKARCKVSVLYSQMTQHSAIWQSGENQNWVACINFWNPDNLTFMTYRQVQPITWMCLTANPPLQGPGGRWWHLWLLNGGWLRSWGSSKITSERVSHQWLSSSGLFVFGQWCIWCGFCSPHEPTQVSPLTNRVSTSRKDWGSAFRGVPRGPMPYAERQYWLPHTLSFVCEKVFP